jgi:hypothetical protein
LFPSELGRSATPVNGGSLQLRVKREASEVLLVSDKSGRWRHIVGWATAGGARWGGVRIGEEGKRGGGLLW